MADEPQNVSTAHPAPETATTEQPSNEFAGLGQDFDDVDVEVSLSESEAGGEQAPAQEAVAEQAPPTQPPVTQPEQQQPPKAAAPPPAEGQKAQAGTAPASQPSGPQPTLVDQIVQHRGDILNELAATRFAWDAGEQKQFMAELETDAAQTLVNWVPRLMARMFYENSVATLNNINQFVPMLFHNYSTLMERQREAEKTFFSQFPVLNKKDHWNDIAQFAAMLGRQNPNIKQADLLAMVGAAVLAKNGLTNAPRPAAGNGTMPPRRTQAPPFVPAQAGGASPVKVQTEPENPFAGLGGYYDDD